MKKGLYCHFKIWLVLGSGALLALTLCLQCIGTYLYADAVLVPQQAQREAERQMFALSTAVRNAGISDPLALGPTIDHALASASDRVLWMRVLDSERNVFAHAGNPGVEVKIPADWREKLEKHESVAVLQSNWRIDSMKTTVFAVVLLLALVGATQAGQLYVGNDTTSPVAVYTTGGTFVQFFGQNSATGSAINAAGDVWTVAPNFGNNNVLEYDQSQTVLNSFVATVNGQWIEDMSHGAGSTLWVSTFEGNVFALDDQTGAILSTFSIPNSSFAGVAFDGTNLWASGGLTSDNLYEFTTAGTLLNTLALGTVCGGVGFDSF